MTILGLFICVLCGEKFNHIAHKEKAMTEMTARCALCVKLCVLCGKSIKPE